MMTVTLHAFIFYLIFFFISELKKKMWMVVCSPMSQFVKKFNIDCCINQKAFTIECSYLIAVKSSCLIDIYIMWKLIKNKELMKYFFRNVLINEQWRCVNVCFVADFFKSSVSLFKAVCKVIWPRFGSGFGILTDFI